MRASTTRSARAATGPTRSRGCRVSSSAVRAPRTARARDAWNRWHPRRRRALRPRGSEWPRSGACWRKTTSAHLARDAQHARTRARIRGDFRFAGPDLGADAGEPRLHGVRNHGQAREDRIHGRVRLDELLDDAVFQGMEADDRQPPANGEQLERLRERTAQLAELVVDVHAQRLERTGRGVLARLAR